MPDTPEEPARPGPAVPAGEDRIAAMPRDPQTVFVYWELHGPRSEQVARELGGGAEWVLRALDLSAGASRSAAVDPAGGTCYVDVTPGHVYGFELAVRAGERWRTVCKSGRVEVPPDRPARAGAGRRGGPWLRATSEVPPEGDAVAGLSFEDTPLRLGSSPLGRRGEESSDGS
jgi:hypothetical protein